MITTFSVVIPHHNIPLLLQRCLDSIPDTPDIQVIVVDDNSSDSVVDFSKFPGKDRKHTTVILDKAGGGAGHARNVGLEHAIGKWLVFAMVHSISLRDIRKAPRTLSSLRQTA